MIIELINDKILVESVVFHPAILETISEDNATPVLPDAHYVGGLDDGVLFGILMVSPVSKYVADVHVHVLPDYRKTHALEFGKKSIEFVFGYGFIKLNAQIPFCCENVKNFAERCGFEVEGINRKSWLKNGVMWDSWYLGLLRAE